LLRLKLANLSRAVPIFLFASHIRYLDPSRSATPAGTRPSCSSHAIAPVPLEGAAADASLFKPHPKKYKLETADGRRFPSRFLERRDPPAANR
jgi:hypothetical protein